MYNNQNLEERIRGNVCNEGYDYHNEVTGHKYFMKWSPQEDMKFYSKSRYGSPRMLSKSVPRKNKNLTRCRINRSLNFDAGITQTELKLKSPNSSSDSIYCEENKQLTRSAKIMKALNLSNSPLSIRKKKVNKTLNFDISPSPKRLMTYNGSPCNVVNLSLSTSSPKLNKSLNFDSSPAESNISSILGTSIDSIDENQNQTPSQRRRSAAKSLKYLTPQRKTSIRSPDFNLKSPVLRTELKVKIDNIIQAMTPNIHSLKKSSRKPSFVKEIFVSTPRNLFNDFDEEDHGGPHTPKNRVRLVPESMSAIKKSHKKERFSRRLEAEVITTDDLKDEQFTEKLDDLKDQRPSTPPVQEDLQTSNLDVNSIKRSHKKDKSKRKLPLNQSEDELSETGSIFDYSEINNISSSCEDVSDHFKLERCKDRENETKAREVSDDNVILTPLKLKYDSDSESHKLDNAPEVDATPESKKACITIRITSPNTLETETNEICTPSISEDGSEASTRPSTPKNHINFLQRVMGSSIKKSHKKVKDENKKKILKSRILQDDLDDVISKDEEVQSSETVNNNGENETSSSSPNRATTPENINSSRLLLPKFISVKKSHKKDKRSNILSSFAKRQQIFSYDKERLSISDCGFKSCSLLRGDFKNQSLQPFTIEELNKSNEDISSMKRELSPNSSETSPNKRKISSSDVDDACAPLPMDDSINIDCITAEEEFKIFTPIKKRRAAPNRKLTELVDTPLDEFEDIPLSRCTTPVLDQSEVQDSTQDHFVTPERSIDALNVPNEPKGKSTPKSKTTPKNRSTMELISNVNSIKRSHKKDKKGSRLTFKNEKTRLGFEVIRGEEIVSHLYNPSALLTPEPSLLSNNTSECSFKNVSHKISKFLKSYENEYSEPSTSYANRDDNYVNDRDFKLLQSYEDEDTKPSTSYESRDDNDVIDGNDDEKEKNEACTQFTLTPPNLPMTKGYLKILQNESIKRSHKKKREELRHSVLLQDSELSDDGSLFSEESRIEDFLVDCAIDRNYANKYADTDNRVSVVVNMNESLFEENGN